MTGSARFVHDWWHEEDIHFFFEVDDLDYVRRHIEMDSAGQFTSAASREEWNRARDYGDLNEYRAHWGGVAEGQLGDPNNIPSPSYSIPISADEFEARWAEARRARAAWWDMSGREEYERDKSQRPAWRPLKADE